MPSANIEEERVRAKAKNFRTAIPRFAPRAAIIAPAPEWPE
jgi:hypothetical protein